MSTSGSTGLTKLAQGTRMALIREWRAIEDNEEMKPYEVRLPLLATVQNLQRHIFDRIARTPSALRNTSAVLCPIYTARDCSKTT